MSPRVKDRHRKSGTAVGRLVFLSATNFLCLRLRPFAACALTNIPVEICALYTEFKVGGKGRWGT